MTERPSDILARLEQWTALKKGEIPAFVGSAVGNWGDTLQADLRDAIAEIARLRSFGDTLFQDHQAAKAEIDRLRNKITELSNLRPEERKHLATLEAYPALRVAGAVSNLPPADQARLDELYGAGVTRPTGR